MKLVLCSEGFVTPNTVQACVDLCDKPTSEISTAIIDDAHAVEGGDKRWVLQNMNAVAENLRGDLDIVSLLALSKKAAQQRLASKDVIFVIGGDPEYLMWVFQETGFDQTFPELLEEKVGVLSSAGAMVAGKRLPKIIYSQLYGEESSYDAAHYLDLVDFSVLPHLDSAFTQEKLIKTVGNFAGKVYGLRDDSAVIVNGPEVGFTGSEPVVIG